MNCEKKIVFLGTPQISADCLKGLVERGFNIVGVVTKEDKVRGRNNEIEASPVCKTAMELAIPVHKPHRLNQDHQESSTGPSFDFCIWADDFG